MLSLPDFKEKTIIFAFLSREDRLNFKNDNVVIRNNGKIIHQSSCYRLFALFIVGHTSVTTGLIHRAQKFGFTIIFLTHSLKYYASWNAQTEGNTLLREKQYSCDSVQIANYLVFNKISGQLDNLKQIRIKANSMNSAIQALTEFQERVSSSYDLSLETLLGIEGNASKIYFQEMFRDYEWTGRKPRIKHDLINSLMDFGYTLLFNMVEALLRLYGFDVYKGVYHKEFYQRKSLVCDLVEPFRPIIDYRIRKAFNLGQVDENDFMKIQGQYKLSWKNSSKYSSWLLKELIDYKVPIFQFIQSYYRSFLREKEIQEYPVFKKIC